MWSRQKRRLLVVVCAAGLVGGLVLEPLLDPVERVSQGYAAVGLLLGLLVFGGVAAAWFARKEAALDGVDERQQAIELRASRYGHGVLLAGVAFLALALSLPWVELPVAALLGALVLASLAVHELSIEYYRRRM